MNNPNENNLRYYIEIIPLYLIYSDISFMTYNVYKNI